MRADDYSLSPHHHRDPDHDRFERAKQEVKAHYEIVTDDADEELNAGRFYYLTGDSDRALAAFRTVEKLDPRRCFRQVMIGGADANLRAVADGTLDVAASERQTRCSSLSSSPAGLKWVTLRNTQRAANFTPLYERPILIVRAL